MLSTPHSARSRLRHGLSLIETAIVLAVVGLIIGGIWVAANSVRNNLKIVNLQKGWLYYGELIARNFTPEIADRYGAQHDIEPFLLKFPLPEGWTSSGGYPVDPFGYSLSVSTHPKDSYFPANFDMGYLWVDVDPMVCEYTKQTMQRLGQVHQIVWWNPACNYLHAYFSLQ